MFNMGTREHTLRAMSKLILGLLIFFGVHSISMAALAWRNRVVERLGKRAWQGLYSLAALIGFYMIISGYGAARATSGILYVTPPWFSWIAAILMLPAFVLALAAVFSGRIQARMRHSLLMAAMLWAIAHLLTNGSVADLLLFGGFLAWSVAVRVSLERRPARRPIALPPSSRNDVIAVAGGLVLYALFIAGLHARLFGVSPLG
jgi:uncharacterized membrane protein